MFEVTLEISFWLPPTAVGCHTTVIKTNLCEPCTATDMSLLNCEETTNTPSKAHKNVR